MSSTTFFFPTIVVAAWVGEAGEKVELSSCHAARGGWAGDCKEHLRSTADLIIAKYDKGLMLELREQSCVIKESGSSAGFLPRNSELSLHRSSAVRSVCQST